VSILAGEKSGIGAARVEILTTCMALRRVLAANDQIIIWPDDMITQAFYIFEIDLTKVTRAGARSAPGPGAITRQAPPFRG
jgi:hypothetical protein